MYIIVSRNEKGKIHQVTIEDREVAMREYEIAVALMGFSILDHRKGVKLVEKLEDGRNKLIRHCGNTRDLRVK